MDDITLIVKGNGIVHVVGFYEPEPEDGFPYKDEEDLGEDDLEMLENDDEESEEEEQVAKALEKPK